MPFSPETASAASRLKLPGEHSELVEQRALAGVQQLVTPRNRRGESLLTGRVARLPPVKSSNLRSRRAASCPTDSPRSGRRQFERERDPIQAMADRCDYRAVLVVEGERRRCCGRSLDKQANSFEGEQCLGRRQVVRRR